MKKPLLLLIFLAILPLQVTANELRFLKYEKNEFQPAQDKVFTLPFHLPAKAKVTIQIFTPDHDLIREITNPQALKAGNHILSWNGKDRDGTIVPDEAYYPVIQTVQVADNKTHTFTPTNTGGEVVENLSVNITPDKNISFLLESPSRVLARSGIKGGPMLKTLSNWQPKNTGKVVLRWDGFDEDKLRDIRSSNRLSIMVRAYKLPEFSIITSGNDKLSYRDYHKKLTKTDRKITQKQPLERNGQRIERHHYFAKDINLNPTVSMKFIDNYPKNSQGLPIISCPCPVRVNLDKSMKTQLQESLYEIAFFVDDKFVSEQEQGYVPFTWRWTPSSLDKGEHILTVNVSGLRGEVGVSSLRFVVK